MAIILVPQPGATPSSLTDWTNSVESLKQYNLSVNDPVDYDFSGNTIKKGVLITIGGSNYYCNADTAITGTPSDYVKITSAGVASYVSDLTGVSWNDTYNFYADVSGNAYIFNEAKAGLVKTKIGAFANNAYFGNITQTSGVTSLLNTSITGTNKLYFDTAGSPNSNWIGTVDSFVTRLYNGRGATTFIDLADNLIRLGLGGTPYVILAGGGNLLINTAVDNGIDKLQVNGSASISGGIKTDNVTVKIKKITGTTGGSGIADINHGLDASKIISVEAKTDYVPSVRDGRMALSGGTGTITWEATQVRVYIDDPIYYNQPITVMITYEA